MPLPLPTEPWNSIEHGGGIIVVDCKGLGMIYVSLLSLLLLILPIYIPKDALQRAAKYLGLVKTNEKDIKDELETINHSPPTLTTISFRVGGVTFEVSRSLVEAFPTTMLFRLFSESKNSVEPIFVECNGNRFEYVLEYMRYGKVFLPDCIPKDVLLHDLKYLDFKNVYQSDIKSHSEALDHASNAVSDNQTEKLNESPHSITTVSFRVGGVPYEVSPSLVEAFPNTMLFKAFSGHGSETILIERNGRRFEYILDYMRDGKVSLPESIPKDVFLRDMNYFGFENVNQSDIKSYSETIHQSPHSLTTVSFCVGGKTYQMNRSLVESFPDTILFKLLSETKASAGSETVFIDRNGSRFEYVLDYMRDGTVSLPECIPKDVFLLEMKHLGFENVNEHNIKSHSEILNHVPRLVSNFKGFQDKKSHEITWDVKRTGTGLEIHNNNLSVKNIESAQVWRSTYGIKGFSSGIHYWNIKIVRTTTKNIMIGVSKGWDSTEIRFPGDQADKGVCYCGWNGNRWFAGNSTSFGPNHTTGDVIGILLNMNLHTVKFYKNDMEVGTAVGIYYLTDHIYYPCVSLYDSGDEIVSSEISSVY